MFGNVLRSAKARRSRQRQAAAAAIGVAALLTGVIMPSPAQAAEPTAVPWTTAGTDIRAVVSSVRTDQPLTAANGSVVVGDAVFLSSGDRIVRVDKASGAVTPVAGSVTEHGCVDAAAGSQARFDGDYDPAGYGPPPGPVVVGYDGHLLYVRDASCGVRSVDPVTGATRTLTDVAGTQGRVLPKSISIAGQTLYSSGWDNDLEYHQLPIEIYQRDLVTGASSVLAKLPESIDVIVADEQYVWAWGERAMHRVDRLTGARTEMPYAFNFSADSWDITNRGNGPFWDGQVVSVGDYFYFVIPGFYDWNAVGRIHKTTGERNLYADGLGTPQGDSDHASYPDGSFGYLSGLAYDGKNLYVADRGAGKLHVISGAMKMPPPPPPPPPATDPRTDVGSTFVQVALGDSYQSGEGVGNSIADTNAYLTNAYENGWNYPERVGDQTNTYDNKVAIPGAAAGNGCHRSLANYAKLNRDRLEPDAKVILIDVTCSGATIQNGRQPIVGTVGTPGFDANSQIADAIAQLKKKGLGPEDVDLVTVGMGGNDAGFGKIVEACLIPNVARRLVKAYPNAPGEIEFAVNLLGSCTNVATYKDIQPQIDSLPAKQQWAQSTLLAAFDRARILQLNYPDVLPSANEAPAWCGGIRKEDLTFAKDKINQIDGHINDTVRASASTDSRYQLVDVQQAFGSNALCPATAEATLAVGINETNFDREVRRLLNLDGNGDPQARALLDQVVQRYRDWKSCWGKKLNPFAGSCDTDAALQRMKDTGTTLQDYLKGEQDTIKANLAAPDSSEDKAVRVDRMKGLFHPNANGFAVLACNVEAAYRGYAAGGDCLTATSPVSDTVNSGPVQNAPIPGGSGIEIHVRVGGYDINIPIKLKIFSTPIELGTVMSDEHGVVDTIVTLPTLEPGVHTLQLTGNNPAGTGMTKQIRVQYAGQPAAGTNYATYLTGFTPNTTGSELVDIIYHGTVFDTLAPDEDGGVFVELPVFDNSDTLGPIAISGRSRTTGKTSTTTIDPVPAAAALHATSTTKGALRITGSGTSVTGAVHSNADIEITGSKTRLDPGAEYATTLTVRGSGHQVPEPRKVAPTGAPVTAEVADYRPGGPAALNAGSAYHAIPATSCKNGKWSVTAAAVPSGVVYVPCAVSITGSGRITAQVVAEGSISVTGASLIIGPDTGAPALISAATGDNAVHIAGAGSQIRGAIQARNGQVALTGAAIVLRCGVTAHSIALTGSQTRVETDNQCRSR